MKTRSSIGIVGGGIFGITAALALRRRGHGVTVVDPGPIPHPDASSTDITKAIRPDYGTDDFYIDLMLEALRGWDEWNATWKQPLYHETGFLVMRRDAMIPGGFEYESFVRLRERGIALEPIDEQRLSKLHPAWERGNYRDGYWNPRAGWTESGNVVAALALEARAAGITILENTRVTGWLRSGASVDGIRSENGDEMRFDTTVACAGAWTPLLLPEVGNRIWSVGQAVMLFRALDPAPFRPPGFCTWAADISNTGWYGFPVLDDGTLKVANHGAGTRMSASDPRTIPPGTEEKFREFLRHSLPAAANAPLVGSRLCLYCDTWDGDFYIDHVPELSGLVIAAGGAGHAFKFAPVLGDIIANVVEGVPDARAQRFRWRDAGEVHTEAARNA